jgi:hypothetical protein
VLVVVALVVVTEVAVVVEVLVAVLEDNVVVGEQN